MTRQEAARLLEYHLKNEPAYIGLGDALRMAIAALNEVGSPTTQLDENGLMPCGCGGKLVLHECPDMEYMTTFYVECDNEECGLSVGRRYDPINHCRRGEFTDTKSAIEASNRAMGYKGGAE